MKFQMLGRMFSPPAKAEPPTSSETADFSETDRLLCLTLDIGEQMLKNGAEIHRVEDTMERICRAYGAAHVDIFVITSLLMAAIRMPDGTYSSQIRRIYGSTKNLYRLEQFNAISRKVCREKVSFDELDRMIYVAKRATPYHDVWVILGSMLAAGAFAVFFGGHWRDGIAAALVGLVISVIDRFTPSSINQMAKTVIHSFVLGVLSFLAVKIGIGKEVSAVTIGAIMLVIPGVEMGTALRDLLCGDLLSGALRTLQAIMLSAMIAFGYAIAVLVMGGVLA